MQLIQQSLAIGIFIIALPLGVQPAIAEDAPAAVSVFSLVGFAQVGGISYASVIDNQTQNHFLLSTVEQDPRLRLTAITESGDAIIEENGQSVLLRLGVRGSEGAVSAPPSLSAVVQNIQTPGHAEETAPTPPPGESLPLVFRVLDPNKLKLTDEQQAILNRLRQNFLAAINPSATSNGEAGSTPISSNSQVAVGAVATPAVVDAQASGGSVANPSTDASTADSAQAQAWQAAQNQSDDMLRMLFGTQAFNLFEMGLAPLPQVKW